MLFPISVLSRVTVLHAKTVEARTSREVHVGGPPDDLHGGVSVLVGEARAQTVDPRRLRLGPRGVVLAAHAAAGGVLAGPVAVAVVGRDHVVAAASLD